MIVIARKKISVGLIVGFIASAFAVFLSVGLTILIVKSILSNLGMGTGAAIMVGGMFCLAMLFESFLALAACIICLVLRFKRPIIGLDRGVLVIKREQRKPLFELLAAEYHSRHSLVLHFVDGDISLDGVANSQRTCDRLNELIIQTRKQNND